MATTLYRPAATRISGGLDASQKRARCAQDWLIVRAGQGNLVQSAEDARLEPGEFRGSTLMDVAKDCLATQGLRVRGADPRDVSRHALNGGSRYGMNLPGNTTEDFPTLLEGAARRILLAAFNTQPDVWSTFCAVGSVSDFRPSTRYRLGTFGVLDRVNEAGEFKRKNVPDGEKVEISAATKGNIIALTRQAMINDDLGAFGQLASALGRAARISIEADVFALLALNSGLGPTLSDGNTLFHAAHNNVAAVAAAPSVASFDAARLKMASHASNEQYLDLRPAIWLGPVGLGGAARVLNGAQYDPDVSNKFQVPNAVNGLFAQVVDSPRLTGTRWYVFASPGVAPVIEVVFLNSVQEPFIDTMDTWTTDGVEMKVRLDYGVGAVDYRGAITNAGA